MFDIIIVDNSLEVKGVIGLFLVNCVGDDIEIYVNEECGEIKVVGYYFCQ